MTKMTKDELNAIRRVNARLVRIADKLGAKNTILKKATDIITESFMVVDDNESMLYNKTRVNRAPQLTRAKNAVLSPNQKEALKRLDQMTKVDSLSNQLSRAKDALKKEHPEQVKFTQEELLKYIEEKSYVEQNLKEYIDAQYVDGQYQGSEEFEEWMHTSYVDKQGISYHEVYNLMTKKK